MSPGALLLRGWKINACSRHGVGEAEGGGLPEPDAGPEEKQPKAQQAKERGEHGAEGDDPCFPVGAACAQHAFDRAGDVEDLAGVVGDAVRGHVAGDYACAQHPEHCGERVEQHAVELLGEDDGDCGGDVVEDHSREGDEAVLEEFERVAPCGPGVVVAVEHLVGDDDSVAHVEEPAYEWDEEDEAADEQVVAGGAVLEREAEGVG